MDAYHKNKLFVGYHKWRAQVLLDGEIPPPSMIEIDPADQFCNQSCPNCPFGSSVSRADEFRKIDVRALISFLTECYQKGTRAFELVGGGEPTTHPEIADIIRSIRLLGDDVSIGMVTNGVRLDRVFDVAMDLEWCRISLDSANLSSYCKIHGVSKSSGHHSKVINNIRKMISIAGRDVVRVGGLIVPPYNSSTKEIHDLVDLSLDLGVKHLALRPAAFKTNLINYERDWVEAKKAVENLRAKYPGFIVGGSWDQRISKIHPKGPCFVRPMVLTVRADGSVPTCFLFRDRSDERPALGHISEGLDKFWFTESHKESILKFGRNECPDVCKFYRVQDALMHLKDNPDASIEDSEIDNYKFI